MEIFSIFGKLCTDYQGHIFLALLALIRQQWQANKKMAVKEAECNGKFQLHDQEFREIKKDVAENKQHQEKIQEDIHCIKEDVSIIKFKIKDKFGVQNAEKEENTEEIDIQKTITA